MPERARGVINHKGCRAWAATAIGLDGAQPLSIACLETIRELLDQPPHCGLLFAGTHELEEIFTRQALELEQWRSRFHAGQALPGISEEEAVDIVHSELGLGLSQRKIHKLISKSRIPNLRNGGQHSYVSARRLFWVIRELQAVVNGASTHARHQQSTLVINNKDRRDLAQHHPQTPPPNPSQEPRF